MKSQWIRATTNIVKDSQESSASIVRLCY